MNNAEEILLDDDLSGAFGYASFEKQAELMGVIERLPMPKRAAAMRKLFAPKPPAPAGRLSARDEAIRRLGALPKEIRDGIAAKKLQIVDARFYAVKAASAVSSVRMLKNDDSKGEGVTNLSKGQLDKDLFFLCTGVMLLSGVDADPKLAVYDTVPFAIANGDFEFKANGGKYIVPKDMPAMVFTHGRTDREKGLFHLENPKWFEPQTDITFDMRFSAPTVANTNIKVVFIGAAVIPY